MSVLCTTILLTVIFLLDFNEQLISPIYCLTFIIEFMTIPEFSRDMLSNSVRAWLANKPRIFGYIIGLLLLLSMVGSASARCAAWTITGP
jgi:hypothetical protein